MRLAAQIGAGLRWRVLVPAGEVRRVLPGPVAVAGSLPGDRPHQVHQLCHGSWRGGGGQIHHYHHPLWFM